jgi:hypothetical protein
MISTPPRAREGNSGRGKHSALLTASANHSY